MHFEHLKELTVPEIGHVEFAALWDPNFDLELATIFNINNNLWRGREHPHPQMYGQKSGLSLSELPLWFCTDIGKLFFPIPLL